MKSNSLKERVESIMCRHDIDEMMDPQGSRFCALAHDIHQALAEERKAALEEAEAKLQAQADRYHEGSGPWSRAMDALGAFRKAMGRQ